MKTFLANLTLKDCVLGIVAIVAIAVGALGAMGVFHAGEEPAEPARAVTPTQAASVRTVPEDTRSEPPRTRLSKKDKTLAIIASHQQRVEEEPDSEESPALLSAMGNLYRHKMGNYEEAIECYLWVLEKYPEWHGILRVYLNLATCYERLGRYDDVRWVYKQMMSKYPKDSQEYLFAKSQLDM